MPRRALHDAARRPGPRQPDHHRYELPVGPADREAAAAQLWAAGAVGLWERADDLVAWFTTRDAAVPDGGTWSLEPDRDWQAAWMATIRPVRAGGFTVVPSWMASDHRQEPGRTVLVIDPGRAFGTGHHATTLMCLEMLDGLDLRARTVTDVGCGTGVLAIAAAGRGARSLAVDVDPDAVAVTRSNARINGVEVGARVGGIDSLVATTDVVVANLVTDVLLTGMPGLAAATGQTLVLSGIASARAWAVEEALVTCGLEVAGVHERDGWVAMVARRRRG